MIGYKKREPGCRVIAVDMSSDYEKLRLQNMRNNFIALKSLGLEGGLIDKSDKPDKSTKTSKKKASTIPLFAGPPRRTPRATSNPDYRECSTYNVGEDDDQCDCQNILHTSRSRKHVNYDDEAELDSESESGSAYSYESDEMMNAVAKSMPMQPRAKLKSPIAKPHKVLESTFDVSASKVANRYILDGKLVVT